MHLPWSRLHTVCLPCHHCWASPRSIFSGDMPLYWHAVSTCEDPLHSLHAILHRICCVLSEQARRKHSQDPRSRARQGGERPRPTRRSRSALGAPGLPSGSPRGRWAAGRPGPHPLQGPGARLPARSLAGSRPSWAAWAPGPSRGRGARARGGPARRRRACAGG